ncbi:GntR family transcriptional regulator [Pseudodesulfovibrio sp. JC047]|uniref:GntR family transcriptional regulator n=1 Tax=Pseudodesulfovibrio sp. JC047 TaxID=2683199 RepID=UPI0013D391D0|nr:GntR family transcriptional regulator [Pseudodesulfovibrio sp. JC047]
MKKTLIKKESLKDQVRTILLGKIISGELPPGKRLKIVPISKALDVSQAPVREAIQCLFTSGYLEHIPNVGFRVREFSDQEVRETYQVRHALEVASLQSLTEDPKALAAELDTHFTHMEQAVREENHAAYIHHNNLFHRSMIAASGNGKMLEVWEALQLPHYMRHTLSTLGLTLKTALPLHPPIIQALKEGLIGQAVKALKHHDDSMQ